MRNEQAASYAAQAYGYLTGRPGACIVVTGPGVVHGLSGLANAQQNCWPMILFGGASETYRGGMGAFQEERQVLIASPFCKFAHGIESVQRIPYYVEMATRNAIYGRPGATYLDVPDDIITGKCDVDKVVHVERAPDPPRMPPRCSPSDAPFSRGIEHLGVITSRPILGGLHHQYCRI
jgi:2-hydroxyacyl-CoA lyase 1